jgi:hypothetical protein
VLAHYTKLILAFLLVVLGQTWPIRHAYAQQDQPSPIKMYTIREAGDGRSTIDGGTRQDPTVWPATLKYNLNDRFVCTSTIIGERAAITAAHCLQDGAVADVRFEEDDKTIRLRCDHHPRFESSALVNDVALCMSDAAFPTRFLNENLDMRITRIRKRTSLFLLGYGCREVGNVGDPTKVGQLYGGPSPVIRMPTAPDDHVQTQGGVVICPGDSGGAAYVPAENVQGPRAIVGINSAYFDQARVSAISVFNGVVAEFIRDWAADNKVSICGVHPTAKNCRDRLVQ